MAASLQNSILHWNPISANFNDANTSMATGIQSISNAGTIFDGIIAQIEKEEENKRDALEKDRRFQEDVRQFNIDQIFKQRNEAQRIKEADKDRELKKKEVESNLARNRAAMANDAAQQRLAMYKLNQSQEEDNLNKMRAKSAQEFYQNLDLASSKTNLNPALEKLFKMYENGKMDYDPNTPFDRSIYFDEHGELTEEAEQVLDFTRRYSYPYSRPIDENEAQKKIDELDKQLQNTTGLSPRQILSLQEARALYDIDKEQMFYEKYVPFVVDSTVSQAVLDEAITSKWGREGLLTVDDIAHLRNLSSDEHKADNEVNKQMQLDNLENIRKLKADEKAFNNSLNTIYSDMGKIVENLSNSASYKNYTFKSDDIKRITNVAVLLYTLQHDSKVSKETIVKKVMDSIDYSWVQAGIFDAIDNFEDDLINEIASALPNYFKAEQILNSKYSKEQDKIIQNIYSNAQLALSSKQQKVLRDSFWTPVETPARKK